MYRVANLKKERPDAYLILRLPSKKRNSRTRKRKQFLSQSKQSSVIQNINFRLNKLQQARQTAKNQQSRVLQDNQTTPRKHRYHSIVTNFDHQKQQLKNKTNTRLDYSRRIKNNYSKYQEDSSEEGYNCQYDRQNQKENKTLRQQNKILNEYFTVFDARYKRNLSELNRLKLKLENGQKMDKIFSNLSPHQSLHAYLPQNNNRKSSMATEFTDLLTSRSSYKQITGKFRY